MGVRLGNGTVVDEAPLEVPVLSVAHTVEAPRLELNSWAPYSASNPAMELDQLKVMVEDPAVVTFCRPDLVSTPPVPVNATALVHVATPPPDTEDTVCPVVPTSANTTSTSPTVLGLTAKVVRAVPVWEVRLPTALMTTLGTVKVN